ncbi:MAG: Arm DNA-binding domain-containing protein, partial [Microvirga sp.]
MGKPLTAAFVASVKRPGRYRDGRNLFLEVTAGGHKGWLFRYERAGRGRWMSLGPARVVTLAEARDNAHQAQRELHQGIDPLDK